MVAFYTPANERSFSSLIDQAIKETGRTSSLRSIISYGNSTIRECQALGLFARDLREVEETATANPHIYTKPRFFRSVRAIRYATCGVYPKARLPGKVQKNQNYYFYAVDDSYVFKGPTVGEIIQMAVYYWARPLIYYGRLGQDTASYEGGPYTTRKAYFDLDEDAWMYLSAAGDSYVTTLGDEDTEAAYRLLAENWVIADWWDLVLEGIKAKIHKQFGDNERASTHYSLYKQQQVDMKKTVGFEAEVGAMVNDD